MKFIVYKFIKYLIIYFNMIKLFNLNLTFVLGLYFFFENEFYMYRLMLKLYFDFLEFLWDRFFFV